jgi:hypothetical protein
MLDSVINLHNTDTFSTFDGWSSRIFCRMNYPLIRNNALQFSLCCCKTFVVKFYWDLLHPCRVTHLHFTVHTHFCVELVEKTPKISFPAVHVTGIFQGQNLVTTLITRYFFFLHLRYLKKKLIGVFARRFCLRRRYQWNKYNISSYTPSLSFSISAAKAQI